MNHRWLLAILSWLGSCIWHGKQATLIALFPYTAAFHNCLHVSAAAGSEQAPTHSLNKVGKGAFASPE